MNNHWDTDDWFCFSHFMQDRFYFWALGFYLLVIFKSIFSSNLLFNQMYFYSNTTYFEGMGDINYFILDGNYTTRLKKEIGPPTRSGFRQVGKDFNSKKRMHKVKIYYVLDSHGELGRFLIPVSWINFKHETYDFISTTRFYKIKNRFQSFWFTFVISLSNLRRMTLGDYTYFIRNTNSYDKSIKLVKKINLNKI